MPVSKDVVPASKSVFSRFALPGFSFLPCFGIAFYRLVAWTTGSTEFGASTYGPHSLEVIAQAIAVVALMLINHFLQYSERAEKNAIVTAGFVMAIGGTLLANPGLIDNQALQTNAGFILRGAGSAVLLLGFGQYLCSVEPKYSALYIGAASVIYGICAQFLISVSNDVVMFLSFLLPFGSCFCLVWAREKTSISHYTEFSWEENKKRFPFDLFLLLFICVLSSAAIQVIAPAYVLTEDSPYGILWVVIYIFIFLAFCFWIFILKRDNPENLLPLLVLIVFCGLFAYTSLQSVNADLATDFMHATRKTLTPFVWILLVTTIYRLKMPSILYFGLGNIIFIQLFSNVRQISSAWLPDGILAGESIGTIIASATALILMFAAVFVIFRQKNVKTTASPEDTHAAVLSTLSQRYGLSPRETEIMGLIARGYTLPQIAESLFISKDTVRTHSKSIYRKLDIHKKQELIKLIEDEQVG